MATIRLGDEAPNFDADTTEGKINFHEWFITNNLFQIKSSKAVNNLNIHGSRSKAMMLKYLRQTHNIVPPPFHHNLL